MRLRKRLYRSPLLEDINLAGANGILVNVTAGMDLSIGEFNEIGDTVKEFASDDATVVIGTVIDPDMNNSDPRDGCGDRAGQGADPGASRARSWCRHSPHRRHSPEAAPAPEVPTMRVLDTPPGKRAQRAVGMM